MDVYEYEPLAFASLLREFDNVTFTPHVGADSQENVEGLYRTGCQITKDIYNGRWPQGVVNPEAKNKTFYTYG